MFSPGMWPEHGGRATEGRLRVDDPVRLEERIDEGVPLRRVAQVLGGAGQIELIARVGAPQRRDKLSAKHATEDLHRQEEPGVLGSYPVLMIGRQPTSRHDAIGRRC